MWFDGRFRSELRRAGLTGFESVMGTSTGRCLRALQDRENWHLELHDAQQRPRGAYLKKHHVRTWRSRLRAKLGVGPGESAGRVEAQNVGLLTAAGIQVMDLVAYGEKLNNDGLLESFVLTEELEGYTELHHFLRRRFAVWEATPSAIDSSKQRASPTESPPTVRRDRDLQQLIRQLAQIVRRLHTAGYNHRDLYCCHFFVKETVRGAFEIKLIDLQRVQHRSRLRRRWVVKDLAQLSWSVPPDRIGCTQKLAFIRHYLGVRKLRPADKRLIREVLAKHETMQRRLGVAT